MNARLPSYDHHAVVSDEERLAQYAAMRECPVARSDEHGGFWILSRHDDVVAACLDPAQFASGQGVFLPDITEGVRTVSLEQDPPEHTATRLLYARMLSRTNIVDATDDIRAAARRHIQNLAAHGGDFVAGVAHNVPVEAIALMVGFSPEVAERVRELTEQLWSRLTGHGVAVDPNAPSLGSVFLQELQHRRDEPRDDFLTQLANITPDDLNGEPVTNRFLVGFLTGAMVAGHETTLNASANLAYLLSLDPALQDRLVAEPALLSGAIDESLRFRSPVQGFVRTSTSDTELHGCPVSEGDKVMVLFGAANHDPERWDEPERFDPERNANGHLSFGWGIHRCIGASFAKIELGLIFEELLAYRIEPDGEPVLAAPSAGGAFLGVDSLPLKLTAR
jgi:cytochrome P450